MRSTRTSAAWAAVAVATTLLGVTMVNAQTQTSVVPTSGVAKGVTLPNSSLYALTSDNSLYILKPGATSYVRGGRVDVSDGGNLIGIDFRPADGQLYGLTDRGGLYTINLASRYFGASTKVSQVNPRFSGGFGALVDFNPVLNALRITGSNDQNIAVVNDANGGNLNTTAVQTRFTYAQGDVNFGKDPEIVGGAYNNNFNGATATLFYLVDHDLDTLVTISGKNATGSSNTGAGLLQTIGSFVDEYGNALNMSPTTDFDIYTDAYGNNFLVGQTTRLLFSIDLTQIDPNLPLGRTQKVVVRRGQPAALPGSTAPITGGVFDIAVVPRR
ncbi:DUF4394 domain-containing protein [Peristeroidobacter agariperforans]|uniref:DUF4394 domain-containing protein n=1 Tax=Peristeroidobacter agariperforans TaxID=268404 RepID=UPI00101BCA44|nr:DUF4394 domain-containing protein [Peristeroidobacter agariperforans]